MDVALPMEVNTVSKASVSFENSRTLFGLVVKISSLHEVIPTEQKIRMSDERTAKVILVVEVIVYREMFQGLTQNNELYFRQIYIKR